MKYYFSKNKLKSQIISLRAEKCKELEKLRAEKCNYTKSCYCFASVLYYITILRDT